MPNSLRYALPVILGLALFSGLSYLLVSATSRGWFEEDVRLRAELALRGARVGVTEGWARGDRAGVERLLTDITKDERVLAAAACAPDSTAFAQTSDFPEGLGCRRFAAVSMADGKPRAWSGVDKSGGTGVFLSALPIYTAAGVPLGVVGIIQDMSYIEHRDRVTRRAAIWFFGLMSLGALLLSTGVARASWGRFRSELRAIVKGGEDRPEFQPLLRDVRELALQLATETRAGEGGRAWTPERLREMLHEHLRDEKLVIVANREPYIHDRDAEGALRVLHPASGLVTALEPVMRACSGTWVAHGSGPADREVCDRNGRHPGAARRGVLHAAARLAQPRGGAGLLLRLLQRGPLAALPHRPRAPQLPRGGLRALPPGQPALRRGGLRGGGPRRPHHPRAGLPLRAGAEAHPRAPAPRGHPHLLAHPLAQRRAVRHLPLPRGDPRRAARQQHRRLPRAGALQQLRRVGGPLPGNPRRPRAHRHRPRRPDHPGASLPHLHRVAQPLGGRHSRGGEVPRGGARRAGPQGRRADRHRRRPPRLHQGHRRAAPRGRTAAGALPPVPRPLHLRPARRAQPHQDRPLPRAERQRGADRRPHQRALRKTAATAPSSCTGATTSRPASSSSCARPTSAT